METKVITFLKNCFLTTLKVNILKSVMSAKLSLQVAGKKKNHSFLVHCAQFGGVNTSLPLTSLMC